MFIVIEEARMLRKENIIEIMGREADQKRVFPNLTVHKFLEAHHIVILLNLSLNPESR